jgi:hypothetical protein
LCALGIPLYIGGFWAFSLEIKNRRPKSVRQPVATADKFPIDKFREEVARRMVPTSEIAHLAAILAGGRQINPETAPLYATQAIELWERCEAERTKKIDRLAMFARADAIKQARSTLPQPKTFPVSLDEALRLWMPKKRPEDRMKCYRDYVRHSIETRKTMNTGLGENSALSVEQEASNWIAADKSSGFKRVPYGLISEQVRRWLPKYEADNRRKRAQAGAAALKRKRQKNG